jgi:hypothetical protein
MNGVTITDVIITEESLKAWSEPLKTWFKILDQYHAHHVAKKDPDVAYWYNERATLSTLAGALWRSGDQALVLEEYSTSRVGNGPHAIPGRTDLWCKIGNTEYTVEAKQDEHFAYPAQPETLETRASTQLTWAEAQCATDKYGGPNRIAMAFMVPSLQNEPAKKDMCKWIDAVGRFKEAHMKAYYFKLPAVQSQINQRFFPGVILLGKLVLTG